METMDTTFHLGACCSQFKAYFARLHAGPELADVPDTNVLERVLNARMKVRKKRCN